MTEILNHHTGEWEPLPEPPTPPTPPYVPLPPGEEARRFRVICYVSVLVFLLTLTILVGLTYVR